jgi:hypothetical protein
MSKFVVLLVYPQHEINKLVKKHKAVFETNIVAQIIQV